ncbi:PAS domain-containing protein [Flavobacterium sp. ZS1P14]|uniref:PAS domain-containing protein n=1 Tax=Flavobacterium sp. ZS1P14 TaxID=3401729 RepID=UPI003AAE7E18
MEKILKILILEDNKSDAGLLLYELNKSRLIFTSEIVETRAAFENALDIFKPDVILSDFNLPSFDGAVAYRIKEKKYPEIPFIIVSGTIGEENAVELIKNGVTDYALKDKLFTLPLKIERALKEAEEKKENKEVSERFSLAARASKDIIYEWKINDDVIWRNDAYYNFMEIEKEKEWIDLASWCNSIHPDDQERVTNSVTDFFKSKEIFWSGEYRFLDNKGKIYYFVDKGYLLRDQNGAPFRMIGSIADVTDLKDYITQLKEMLFMTSHRVRQPIANILGLSNELDDPLNDPAELKQIVDYIKFSAINLEEFTHELNHFIQNSKDKAENKIQN